MANKKQTFFFVLCSPNSAHMSSMSSLCAPPCSNELFQQPQPHQILILPTGVRDHGAQCANRKGIVQGMISNHDATAISMFINAMAPADSLQRKSISFQCAN